MQTQKCSKKLSTSDKYTITGFLLTYRNYESLNGFATDIKLMNVAAVNYPQTTMIF